MNPATFQPRAYLLVGCPYSFKFLLFMSEAGILDEVDVVRCDPNDPEFELLRARLAKGLGKRATFPTVEVEPGQYVGDSDALIKYFSKKTGLANFDLPALQFYKDSIMPQVVKLHKEQHNQQH